MENEEYIMQEDQETFEGPLVQTSPPFLVNIFSLVTGIISSFGWFILLGSIVCIYVWKSLHPKIERWKEDAEHHKNPDKFIEREISVTAARQRMQEKYDELARKRAEQLKEEETRRAQEVQKNATASSQSSGSSSANTKSEKTRLRPAFNPMMADTSSCSFRPGGGRRRTGGG